MCNRLAIQSEPHKGVSETVTFRHSAFQAGGKTFAVFEQYKREFGLAVKVEELLQAVFLKDPRFYLTPYIGKHGWATPRMEGAPLNWREIGELVKNSHRLIAPKRLPKTKPVQ